jgi:hypothetical protein
MINTSAALAASSTDIANTIKSRHAMQEQTLTQFLQQRQLRGELPRTATCASWRSFLTAYCKGCRSAPAKAPISQTDANRRHHAASVAAGLQLTSLPVGSHRFPSPLSLHNAMFSAFILFISNDIDNNNQYGQNFLNDIHVTTGTPVRITKTTIS